MNNLNKACSVVWKTNYFLKLTPYEEDLEVQ